MATTLTQAPTSRRAALLGLGGASLATALFGSQPAQAAELPAEPPTQPALTGAGPGGAYSKRLALELPLQFPDWDLSAAKYGNEIFPQGFAIDGTANEVLVVYCGNKTVVAVYNWTTGAYKGSFAVDSTQTADPKNYATSEGAQVLYENGTRYLYLVIGSGRIARFPISPVVGKAPSVVAPDKTWTTGNGVRLFHTGTHWVSSYGDPQGQLMVMDRNFKVVGTGSLSPSVHGGWSGTAHGDAHPKFQGMHTFAGMLVASVGGHHSLNTPAKPYGYQGIRAFTFSGHLLIDALMDPLKMVAILKNQKLLRDAPSKIESEGVVAHAGKLYSLITTQGWNKGSVAAKRGGLAIFEEFSTHPKAVDFGQAAVMSTAPDYRLLQSGLLPRAANNVLCHPGTGAKLTSLAQVADMMVETGMSVCPFSTAGAALTDINGAALPRDTVVTMYQLNKTQIHVVYAGAGGAIVLKKAGSSWAQSGGDTGEIPLKIIKGIGAYSPAYSRTNGWVDVTGAVQLREGTAESPGADFAPKIWYRVAQLDQGFRPARYQYYPANAAGSPAIVNVRVTNDGWIEVQTLTATPASVTLSGIHFRAAN